MMKKTALLSTITASMLASATAATVSFSHTDFVAEYGYGAAKDSMSVTVTGDDGISFTLTLASAVDGYQVTTGNSTNDGRICITDGTENTNANRIEEGQGLKFSLAVDTGNTGLQLDSLSIGGINLSWASANNNNTRDFEISNGNGTSTINGPFENDTILGSILGDWADIPTDADGLNDWYLDLVLTSEFVTRFEGITFEYTTTPIPEPSTAGLLGVMTMGALLRRRR
ncbi:PEP-CTERM sorting domain-containing protein [Persicirhabdus sediminis]|uniref:PEP-CTERM sorting domain-containing protein n=1 Tax=Persicirhabdus sediminis TaxID=454144 RepID=A0A8J7SNC0_9BACT|nr:PEP-CTERM sorting domain-containing protein [Persicirhabdus sediminis]MBK1791598.1 PEP-CTERM sorting domain-containing protein [Persicirhabdus sediminis]